MVRWLHINSSKIGLDQKDVHEIIRANRCLFFFHQLVITAWFLARAFFSSLFFLNMLTNPISSQVWIFVTSHLSSLSRPLLTKILAVAKKSFDCRIKLLFPTIKEKNCASLLSNYLHFIYFNSWQKIPDRIKIYREQY